MNDDVPYPWQKCCMKQLDEIIRGEKIIFASTYIRWGKVQCVKRIAKEHPELKIKVIDGSRDNNDE